MYLVDFIHGTYFDPLTFYNVDPFLEVKDRTYSVLLPMEVDPVFLLY